jgi:hypothetical protein
MPKANKGIVVLSFNLIGVFAIVDDEDYRLATQQGGAKSPLSGSDC